MPQALLKSSVLLALCTKFGAPSTQSMSCAPGTTNCPLHSVNTCLLPAWLVTPPVCKWPDFLGRNVIVPSLSGLSDFLRNWFWSSLPLLASPKVIWAEPSSTWFQLYCTLQWYHALPKSACWPLLKSCTFTALFSSKEDEFCMTLGLATGWLTCSCLMLMCFCNTSQQL